MGLVYCGASNWRRYSHFFLDEPSSIIQSNVVNGLLKLLKGQGGFVTLENGKAEVIKKFGVCPWPGKGFEMVGKIKSALDPANVFYSSFYL